MQTSSKILRDRVAAYDWSAYPSLEVFYAKAHQDHEGEKIILSVLDKVGLLTKNGPTTDDEGILQVDIYAHSMADAQAISYIVRAQLDWYSSEELEECLYESEGESFSEVTEMTRITQTYNVHIKNSNG